jgi:hypothetical protein
MKQFVKYESLGVFISNFKKGAYSQFDPEDIDWISRVQDSSYAISLNRDILKQIGDEDFFIQKLNTENFQSPTPPTSSPTDEAIEPAISFDLSYLLTDGSNEKKFGLGVNKVNCENPISFASKLIKDQNFFIVIGEQDLDLLQEESLDGSDIIELTNCYLSRYSFAAGVGNFPMVSTGWIGSNVAIKEYSDEEDNLISAVNSSNPTLPDGWNINKPYLGTINPDEYTFELPDLSTLKDPEVSALRPSDISLTIPNLEIGGQRLDKFERKDGKFEPLSVDSFSIDINFPRKDLYGIGSIYAFDRKINYPIEGRLNMSIIIDELLDGSLSRIFEQDTPYDMEISIKNPCLDYDAERIKLKIENAVFVSKRVKKSIGGVATLDVEFYFSITSTGGFYFYGEDNLFTSLWLKSDYDNIGTFNATYSSNSGDQDEQEEDFENWVTNDGNPSLEISINGQNSDLTVDMAAKEILNASLNQVGTIEYWLLDDSVKFDGGCVDIANLNLGEEIDTWAEVLTKLNELASYCSGEQIMILYQYNYNGSTSENFRILNFNKPEDPLVSVLEFDTDNSEVGYNYQVSDSLFTLATFITDIDIDSTLTDATFILTKDNVTIQTFEVQDVLNADLSTFQINLLEVGDYTLSLSEIKDCNANISLKTDVGVESSFNFSVVEYEMILPNNLTFESDCPSGITNVPAAVINKNGQFFKNVNPDPLTLSLALGVDFDPVITNITWADSLVNHYRFSENEDATVQDTTPPQIINFQFENNKMIPDNVTNTSLADLIDEAVFYDNCLDADSVISFYKHSFGNQTEYLVIDPDDILDAPYQDSFGNTYTKYNDLSSAILNSGAAMNQGSHTLTLIQLEDGAGNYINPNISGIFYVGSLELDMPINQTIYLEAGISPPHNPENAIVSFDGFGGGGSQSVAPTTYYLGTDLVDAGDDVEVDTLPIEAVLIDPAVEDVYEARYSYDDGIFSNYQSYRIIVTDRKVPTIRKVNFTAPTTYNANNFDDITFESLNPDLDIFDKGSGYLLDLVFKLYKPNGTVEDFNISATDRNTLTIADFDILTGTPDVGSYNFVLYSATDQMGNSAINLNQNNNNFSFVVGQPFELAINPKDFSRVMLEPQYTHAAIVICYDTSNSMFSNISRWNAQTTWIKNIVNTLKEVESSLYNPGTFQVSLVRFSSDIFGHEASEIALINGKKWNFVKNMNIDNITDEELRVVKGGTYFEEGIKESLSVFKSGPKGDKWKRVCLFTSDGAPNGPNNPPTYQSLLLDMYRAVAFTGKRIITYPVMLPGAYKNKMQDVGRLGQGLVDESDQPDPLQTPKVLDASKTQDISLITTLEYVSPYNGLITYEVFNKSYSHDIYINDSQNGSGIIPPDPSEDYIIGEFYEQKDDSSWNLININSPDPTLKIAGIAYKKDITRLQANPNLSTNEALSGDLIKIGPRERKTLYFNIWPNVQELSDSLIFDPVPLDFQFNLNMLAIREKGSSEDLRFFQNHSLDISSTGIVSINTSENYASIKEDVEFQVEV